MSQKPRGSRGGEYGVVLASIGCLSACAAGLFVMESQAYFRPFLLLALILLLPAAINLCLLIPVGKPKCEAPEAPPHDVADESPKKTRAAVLKSYILRAMRAVARFAISRRTPLLAMLLVLVVGAANALFWSFVRGKSYASQYSYLALVILAALFVLFIVFGKWCKYRTPKVGEGEGDAKRQRYTAALLRNLQSAFLLGRLALLLSAVAILSKLVLALDLSKYLTVALSVLCAYKTVFMLISLFVVLVRKELDVAPEISAPAPGLEGGDLGILNYLEKNTGISMRSLWSIQMIKQALPYAALGAVLLLWGVTGIVTVNSNQEGAHYRLGRLQEETLQPGLHLTLPWPFDKVEVYDTKTVNQMTVGYVAEQNADNFWTEAHGSEEYRLLLGGGNELVSINLRVMYRISDLRAYLTSSATPEFLMSAASYEIVTARTITSDLDAMLSADRAVFADTFSKELMAYMEKYQTGLEVVSVVLESIHPPVEVADAYQALISAEIEADQLLIDAEAYRGERLAWAWVDYDTQVALETMKGTEAVAAAKSSVAEFLASVEADRDNPVDYRYYKYMQAISKAYADARIVIVGNGVNEENIYIGSLTSDTKE